MDRHALSHTPSPLTHWLTQSAAAAHSLVSTRTIRRWIACGYVRATRPAGGRVLIDAASLERFLAGGAP